MSRKEEERVINFLLGTAVILPEKWERTSWAKPHKGCILQGKSRKVKKNKRKKREQETDEREGEE